MNNYKRQNNKADQNYQTRWQLDFKMNYIFSKMNLLPDRNKISCCSILSKNASHRSRNPPQQGNSVASDGQRRAARVTLSLGSPSALGIHVTLAPFRQFARACNCGLRAHAIE